MRDQSGLESGVWCGETRGNRRDQSGPHSKGDKAGCRIPGQLQRFIVAHTLHERVTSATPASVVFFQDMLFNKVFNITTGGVL